MDMSEYVATLRRELGSISRFAGEDVTRAAEMLSEAMESSVRLTLLEVLSAAADEITTRLDDAVIEVRLSGLDADFVVSATAEEPAQEAAPPTAAGEGSEDVARVTLRISEPLKARVEGAANAAGVSVNAWLIRAISQALDAPSGSSARKRRGPGVGQRYTGYARG
jgi:predicted HicB family RNase H-like nuclease